MSDFGERSSAGARSTQRPGEPQAQATARPGDAGAAGGDDLWYVGVTHRSAPLAVRENLHASDEKQRAMLERLADSARGRMVVATCERFELYVSTTRSAGFDWTALLAQWFHVPAELIGRYAVVLRGDQAARHLLRVAAGLDSRVLGEPHVLGQVRAAYLQAIEATSLDAVLFALGRAAIHAGKRVRAETKINEARRSIATLAVEHLRACVREWTGASVLVTGTGQLARDVGEELRRLGVGRIVIVGRNREHAEALAEACHGVALSFPNLSQAMDLADGVISCTGAASYVIEPPSIGGGRASELRIVDLSVPRNVDPAVARLPRVGLTTMETLLAEQPAGAPELAGAERVVHEELQRFTQWRRERIVAAELATLTQRCTYRPRNAHGTTARALHDRIIGLKREAVA